MKPDDERAFFGHDLATPITNLVGAHFLLKMALKGDDLAAREALEILEANTRTLERMLGWYWRLRELEGSLVAVPPWPAAILIRRLRERVEEEALPVLAPELVPCDARLQIPPVPLETGLIGAAITLASASGREVSWRFEGGEGVLFSCFEVTGDQDLLDPERLFRKVYWPSRHKFPAWLDPCLPYLRAVLEPFGGNLELVWEEGRWTLTAALPLLP
jgi:hypothetical protein